MGQARAATALPGVRVRGADQPAGAGVVDGLAVAAGAVGEVGRAGEATPALPQEAARSAPATSAAAGRRRGVRPMIGWSERRSAAVTGTS